MKKINKHFDGKKNMEHAIHAQFDALHFLFQTASTLFQVFSSSE
jgi:hypothetical protein